MKKFLVSLSIIFLASCASIKSPVGDFEEMESPTQDVEVFAQLEKGDGEFVFGDTCRVTSENLFPRECNDAVLDDPWNGYVRINDGKPAFRTKGMICNTVFFIQHDAGYDRTPTQSRPSCKPAPYWEADIAWGEFGQYLFVFPIIGLAYAQEVYFDYDAYERAFNEAAEGRRERLLDDAMESYAQLKKKEERRREAEIERRRSAEERRENKIKEAREVFEARRSRPLKRGQEVCTPSNRYGYVEDLSADGERIKVRVMGKARNARSYAYFGSESGSHYSTEPERVLWEPSEDWAVCDFKIR